MEKQKADIRELTDLFRGKMSGQQGAAADFSELFKAAFKPQSGTHLKYRINLKGKEKPLVIRVDVKELQVEYGEIVYPDVELTMEERNLF